MVVHGSVQMDLSPNARQVPDAQVALVTSGLYMQCGAFVLTAGS